MITPCSHRHIFAVVLAVMFACSSAGAQMRGGSISVRTSTAHVAPAYRARGAAPAIFSTPFPTARPATVIRLLPNGQMSSSFSPTADFVSFGDVNNVPGLGFDYTHLAAISGALHNHASRGFGRGSRRGQSSFVPILFGGYPFYGDYSDYDQPPPQEQPQPQVIVIQQPVPTAAPQSADTGYDPAAASSLANSAPPAAPVRDVGEFVLVLRDGRILFASVFSVVGAQLQYVTPEGFRHTLPMSELDSQATEQMNEARGTTVQLRN